MGRWFLPPWLRHRRRFHIVLTVQGVSVFLNPKEHTYMASTLNIGHQLSLAVQVLDQNGNKMLVQPTFDAPPVWTNTTPATETVVADPTGLTAVGTPIAPGTDTISVSFSIGGVPFSSGLAVTVDPAPQVATSAAIVATVI